MRDIQELRDRVRELGGFEPTAPPPVDPNLPPVDVDALRERVQKFGGFDAPATQFVPDPQAQLEPLATRDVEQELRQREEGQELAPLQRFSQRVFGIEQTPISPTPRDIFPKPPEMTAMRDAGTMMRDVSKRAEFMLGIDPMLRENFALKLEMQKEWAEREKVREFNPLLFPFIMGFNAIKETGEIVGSLGVALIGLPIAAAFAGIEKLLELDRTKVFFVDQETGQRRTILFPFKSAKEMPADVKRILIDLGAEFGPPNPEEEDVFNDILRDFTLINSLQDPDQIPQLATSFGVPFTDKRFNVNRFIGRLQDRPITAAIDLGLLAAAGGQLPAAVAGRTLIRGGRLAARFAGRVPNLESRLVRLGVGALETSEALAPGTMIRTLLRKGAALSEGGRAALASWDARVAMKELVNESSILSFSGRQRFEVPIGKAMKELTDEELKLLPLILEGRADLREIGISPGMRHAIDVVKAEHYKLQSELIQAGGLKVETAEARRIAPLVNVRSGKLIPRKDWTDPDIIKENKKILKFNARNSDNQPLYLKLGELQTQQAAVRKELEGAAQNLAVPENVLITDITNPIYFPRFSEPINIRDILKEFFMAPGIRKPGRLPIQHEFTGMSILRGADIKDVQQQLFRYNAQVRRLVDSMKLIERVKTDFALPLVIEARGFRMEGKGALLPGYAPYNPEGALQFFRKQIDLSETTARRLDQMGDLESALAAGIRESLGDGLRMSFLSAKRRTRIFQIPRSARNVLDKNFTPTSALTRIVFDRPLDAWKTAVLAFSVRWHVNNIVGGMIFGLLGGVPPSKLLKPLTEGELKLIPDQIARMSFVASEAYRPHLGAAADTVGGRMIQALERSKPIQFGTKPLRVVRDKSYGFNQAVDNHFRSRVYLVVGEKQARRQLMKETGKGLIESRDIITRMGEIAADPRKSSDMLKRLRRIFFDFNNLTPFERRWMRRMFPFWTWYREIARVTVSMPGRFPGRAAILKGIGDLGEKVQEEEFRKHMGFRPKDFPQYLRGNTFVGFDIDGNTVFFSARGLNVFYGIGQNPLTGLRPDLKALIESQAGGRQMGRWGSFIPFRFLKQFKGRTGTGEEVGPRVTARTFLSELVRSLPPVRIVEDVAQWVTEGEVSQRFLDVTPFSNLPGPFQADPNTGLAPEPFRTGVLQPSREFRAKGTRPLTQTLLNFLGLPIVRYRIEEILEQHLKSKKTPVSTVWRQLYIADPEFREKMNQFIEQNAGRMTPDEGLRAFRPEKKGK